MKADHESQRRDLEFALGDWVWVHLQYRSAVGITPQSPGKLSQCYYGPFRVLESIGTVSYRLELPSGACIHNVFHVALLKKYEGAPPVAPVLLPSIVRGRVVPEPEAVLKTRLNRGS